MNNMRELKTIMIVAVAWLLVCCTQKGTEKANGFVERQGAGFVLNGKEYRYVGTNFWYGAILGSEGQGGNRARLCHELDKLHELGLDNLRILVGSDGLRGVTTKVEPTLQEAPGVYNDTILAGLDYLLQQMGERSMKAVLYLNNAWEWSGGYGFYLEQAGAGKAPRPNETSYPEYMNFVSQFSTNTKAQELFFQYVRDIIGRTNRYTNVPYVDDPTIMAWQIGNEPRAFSEDAKAPFAKWLRKASELIRSLDKNHLISIGSEGIWGCEMDSTLYEQICADPNIDYMNAHVWPYNWSWVHKDSLAEHVERACRNTADYIHRHTAIAERLQKPLVIEEFGYPRDDFKFEPGSKTAGRDHYYDFVFSLIKREPMVYGCNFWGWGGEARPNHEQWLVGDDYCGDPAQEQQGLNSVFDCDTTTLEIIMKNTKTPSEQLAKRLQTLQQRGYMMGHQDDPMYGVTWEGTYQGDGAELGRSDVLATVGDYPAVMGFDLGGIEMGDAKNLDSVPFKRIHDELIAHYERGGIVTLSWHPRNPLTDRQHGGTFPQGSAWDVTDSTVVRNVLKGGSQYKKFQTWMTRVGDFMATLKTADGQPIPIIFRPWHENNGSWFWWGQKLCTDDEFRGLWNMLQDYLTDERGLSNLLWSYSPNLDGGWTEERFMQRYPGNDRVTLIGEDAYQWGTEDDFKSALTADLAFLSDFAKKNGKLLAMTECGLKNMTDPTWWTRVLKPIMDQYPISYFLLWRNYKEEYFGPSPELPCAADFKKLYASKNVLFLKEIKQ